MSTNSASFGGGISNGKYLLIFSTSIIAANNAQQGPDIFGSLTSRGYNLIQDITEVTGLDPTTDKQVKPSELYLDETLRDNGGPTWTLALLPGSVAIDAAPLEACHPTFTDAVSGKSVTIITDQRGKARPDDSESMCDIGAYESSY